MTIYEKAYYKKYSDIVSLKTPAEARKSVSKLRQEFNDAKTKQKKIRIWRVANLASNRAFANLKKSNLSFKERQEYRQIAGIYRNFADSINR